MASDPIIDLPAGWPAVSIPDANAALTAPGASFEMEELPIRGVATRVWKNAPPTLRALLDLSRGHGERIASILDDERVSYEATWRAAATMAHTMVATGVAKGDRVALLMRNLPEWPVALFACAAIGAIAVPLNAWWTGDELEYGINDSGARLLIADGDRLTRLDGRWAAMPGLREIWATRADGVDAPGARALADIIGPSSGWHALPDRGLPEVALAPDDDATIFYTSGTTGRPKGALGTHRNLVTNIFSSAFAAARRQLRAGETPTPSPPKVILATIPLFHVTACSATLMGAFAAGHTIIYMRRWDALEAMAIIQRERVSMTGGVPTIAWQLLEHPERARFDLSSLETIAYGGAPSAPDLVRRIHQEFGALPSNGWGMTETMATVTQNPGADYLARPSSCGTPVPVAELKIMAPDASRELPTGEVGELWAKGPMVVRGYWGNAAATAETFVDGWVRTGDLARLDEDGFCYIVDRAKDMVIRGGENIYSIEVENALYAHPAVTDAAIIGLPHRTLGEEPAAVVHLAPGTTASERELQDWVRARLAAFKVPVAIRFHDTVLPRNANGKILKGELRALFDAA